MELTKYGSTEILAHIKHDLRQLPEGKSYGNESVDLTLSHKNYSLIDRGSTAKEINKYRKDFERGIFKYNRKNLVHAVELVIQCPSDCPPEQHDKFFQTAFDWYCNNFLPAGRSCVFIAQVHKDEHKYITTENGLKDISKEHLHICYVPAIPAGEKHPDYKYRLNADALTKKVILRKMHPSLQAELDSKGIQATVFQKKSGDGKAVALSVKQLKEITSKTGIVIDHTLTVDDLANILSKNVELTRTVSEQKQGLNELKKMISDRDQTIDALKIEARSQKAEILINREKNELKNLLHQKDVENQKIKASAQRIIAEKDIQLSQIQEVLSTKEKALSISENKIQMLQEKLYTVQEQLKSREIELQKEREKLSEPETKNSVAPAGSKEHTWGADSAWGTTSGWGNTSTTKTKEYVEEVNL